MIAEHLVEMAINETGFSPSHSGRKILIRFVKRKVAGEIQPDVIEMLKDVMMSELSPKPPTIPHEIFLEI